MKFGPIPLADAEGAILAHSLKWEKGAIKKGARLTAAHLDRLAAAGFEQVTAAVLEPGDVSEDEAASRIAHAIARVPHRMNLSISAPFTGRSNLFATSHGVFWADTEVIDKLNSIHEGLTVATLPPYARVAERQMVATVKIIPYAVSGAAVDEAEFLLGAARGADRHAFDVRAFKSQTVSLILTRTPGMADRVVEKGAEAVRARLEALGVCLSETVITPHQTAPLAAALREATGDVLLILAGSATSDRRDVAPAAMEAAGGAIERLGMPVDPGNLLVLGRIGNRPALGLPGCARSPKLNGADWVLERLIAGLRVSSEDIARMGVGGLLKEIPSRPQPRHGGPSAPSKPFVSAVMLAAGGSRRMGDRHKLLELVDGAPLVRHAAERLLASGADELVTVLGARSDAVSAALQGLDLRRVENPLWAEGMASSLRAGLRAVNPNAAAILLAFADMPEVSSALIDRLLAAFDPEEGREIIRPVTPDGRPGHPVLFGRRFFEALSGLTGDAGAREVVREHAEFVVDVQTDDDAAIIDLDTPEAWEAWRAQKVCEEEA